MKILFCRAFAWYLKDMGQIAHSDPLSKTTPQNDRFFKQYTIDSTRMRYALEILVSEKKRELCMEAFEYVAKNYTELDQVIPAMCSNLAHEEPIVRRASARFLHDNCRDDRLSEVLLLAHAFEESAPIKEIILAAFKGCAGWKQLVVENLGKKLNYNTYAQTRELENSDSLELALILAGAAGGSVQSIAARRVIKALSGATDLTRDKIIFNAAYNLGRLVAGREGTSELWILAAQKLGSESAGLMPLLSRLIYHPCSTVKLRSAIACLALDPQGRDEDRRHTRIILDALEFFSEDRLLRYCALEDPSERISGLEQFHRHLQDSPLDSLAETLNNILSKRVLPAFYSQREKIIDAFFKSLSEIDQNYKRLLDNISDLHGRSLVVTIICNSLEFLPQNSRQPVKERLFDILFSDGNPALKAAILTALAKSLDDDGELLGKLKLFFRKEHDPELRSKAIASIKEIHLWQQQAAILAGQVPIISSAPFPEASLK